MAAMDQALEVWAEEAACSEIDMSGGGNFARVWIFSAISAIALLLILVVPFIWCRRKPQRVYPEGGESPEHGHAKTGQDRQNEAQEDLKKTRPDRAAALRHLKRSSATVDDEYLSPFFTGIEKMSRVGGTGTVLYFQTLRTMGYLFATMAAITFPTTAFCLLGTFAPDNGQILARTSIGNLGLYVDTKILDPLLRIVRVSCDGMQLSDLTAIFAWLDLIAVFMLFCYLLRFRFYEIPQRIESDDLNNVSVNDFAVMVEKLPKRIDDQKNYEKELKAHLEGRMRAVQHHGEKKPQPEVREITLVRDFNGRLDALQEQARLTQQISVQQAYEKEKKVAKLQEKKAKLDQKIEMQMPEESDLPVLRAFVILNRVEDVHSLLYDYRLARFGLFRCCFPCLSRKRCFHGHAIRVREAPAPTDLLWENADTPWISRLLRQTCMFLTFIIILAIAVVLIYVITVLGKSQAGDQLSYIGHPLCDPIIPSNSSGEEEKYICFVNVAANWTKDYAVGQGGDILNCWCESQGYAKLAEDPSLINTCSNWLLELGKSIGIMTAASMVVLVINLLLQYVLIAMARFERPLSNTALNQSMMQKIFLAQTINTGFVLFMVNTYGPQVANLDCVEMLESDQVSRSWDELEEWHRFDRARKKLWQEAVQLLKDLGSARDAIAINCTISACGAALRWEQALVLLPSDPIGASAVLSACGRAQQWQRALAVLTAGEAHADVGLYNAAISVLKKDLWMKALGILQRLQDQAFRPDLVSFNATLSALASARRWQQCCHMLALMNSQRVVADGVSLSSCINAVEQAWPLALELLEQASEKDTVLCGSAISALTRHAQWEHALQLFFDMEHWQIRPNLLTCSAALSACEKGVQWTCALEIFEGRRRRDWDGVAYCSILSVLGKASQWPAALALFRQSQQGAVQPSNFTFNATMSACEKGQQWPWALELFKEMSSWALSPDLISYNACIEACAKGARPTWGVALEVFSQLLGAHLQPDAVSFNALLNAPLDPPLAEAIFLEALEAKVYPWLFAKGPHVLDLHDLSPGAAHIAIAWWLREKNYWSGRHPSGLELICGLGLTRKTWASNMPLRRAAEELLTQLDVPWADLRNGGGGAPSHRSQRLLSTAAAAEARDERRLDQEIAGKGSDRRMPPKLERRDFVSLIPGLGNLLLRGPFEDLTRAWYVVVGATIMTNMLLNMVTPPSITIAMIFVTKFMRCCCRSRVKHHSELIQIYTNPDFDIKAKYAQLLTTCFVTLTYSSGMPLLYLFAFGYMGLMYWADKISLLWYSKRPPQYDALLAQESSEAMLYAVALHCIFAIIMFGQPCVFPSQPLGGDLGELIQQNGGEASGALGDWWPRLTQESTWMFVVFFALLLSL
ncbi:Pentatricopeptide repeat-containing protein At1g63080 [Durusdinium trenchii]|uniref:Mitochondrial n=1 Tax=Durusdinium trenchii TaxID=1381693 RepID=A0ABP0N4J2_9DINO